jgi:hypothetical protein
MNRDLDRMRRRPFFFPLLLPVLVFFGLLLAAIWVFDGLRDDYRHRAGEFVD